jgi:hypothetical protein
MLKKILDQLIKVGRLTVISPNGRTCAFGEVVASDARLDVTVRQSARWGGFCDFCVSLG